MLWVTQEKLYFWTEFLSFISFVNGIVWFYRTLVSCFYVLKKYEIL